MKNYKNTEEQISRIKQLITEETLYGKLVDNNIISEVAGGTRGIVNTFLNTFYKIPTTKFDNVTKALGDITDDTLKELDSFKRINKVIDGNELGGKSGSFTSTDFKTYIGGKFITDLNKFFDEVNGILDSEIYSGMRKGSPDTTGGAYQVNWAKKKDEVIKELKELNLSDGSVSVGEVKETFLGNFDNFIKNYGKIANNYTNQKTFKFILTHIFGNHEGKLKGILKKIKDYYKNRVFNIKDYGNPDEYISRYKTSWGEMKDIPFRKTPFAKIKKFALIGVDTLPKGYLDKYFHWWIAKTTYLQIICKTAEGYSPEVTFEHKLGIIDDEKIITEQENPNPGPLDAFIPTLTLLWDNLYLISSLFAVLAGIPISQLSLDPMSLLGSSAFNFDCENFYVKTAKELEADISALATSGEKIKLKNLSGGTIELSGTQLKGEFDKITEKLKNADILDILQQVLNLGAGDIAKFTLVGDNGE
jgi:hypothetical protein